MAAQRTRSASDALWDLISAAEEEQLLHAHIHDPSLSTVFNATATHMAAVPDVATGMHQSCESVEGPAHSDLDLIEASEGRFILAKGLNIRSEVLVKALELSARACHQLVSMTAAGQST